jgi:anti-sigma-K factor RskA
MHWMISLSPDHRKLSITASDDYFSVGRGCIQLWWLSGSEAPKPLAILGTERDSTVTVDVPAGLSNNKTIVFAISIEPSGGSPTGQPTGPVLDQSEKQQDF